MKVYLNYWSDVLLSSSQECFTQVISPAANTQGAVILGLQMSHPDPDRFHWACQCMKNTVTKCWCAGKKDLKHLSDLLDGSVISADCTHCPKHVFFPDVSSLI